MMSRSYSFRVPASTSNLGAGFDALGLALDRYLRVNVEIETLTRRFAAASPRGRGKDCRKINVNSWRRPLRKWRRKSRP